MNFSKESINIQLKFKIFIFESKNLEFNLSLLNDAGIFDRNIQNENSTRNDNKLRGLEVIIDGLKIQLKDSESSVENLKIQLNDFNAHENDHKRQITESNSTIKNLENKLIKSKEEFEY